MTRIIKNNHYECDDRVLVITYDGLRVATIINVCTGSISRGREFESIYKVIFDDAKPHEVNCWYGQKCLVNLPIILERYAKSSNVS